MERKIIFTKLDERILTTVFEDGRPIELHCERAQRQPDLTLGNIYVGRVKKVAESIGAAFIEIADGVEGYYSLEKNPAPIFTRKVGKKPLCAGDELLVQISGEAVKTKALTLTGKLSFTGKYAALTSGDTRTGASRKLPDKERNRLIRLAKEYRSASYGLIMRTNAKEAGDDVLRAEIERLIAEYEMLLASAGTRTCFSCVKKAPPLYLSDLRSVLQEDLSEIVAEDPGLYQAIRAYLETYQPEDLEKLRLYEDRLLPLHKLYRIEKIAEDAVNPYVWMKSGAYLVIQPTEALTVIDVNTGKSDAKKKAEDTCFRVNLEAAKEAAHQIRLRNLTGIIVVDFINLSDPERTADLLAFFEKELGRDPVATTLEDITKLGLVEITRKKIRKPFHEAFCE